MRDSYVNFNPHEHNFPARSAKIFFRHRALVGPMWAGEAQQGAIGIEDEDAVIARNLWALAGNRTRRVRTTPRWVARSGWVKDGESAEARVLAEACPLTSTNPRNSDGTPQR